MLEATPALAEIIRGLRPHGLWYACLSAIHAATIWSHAEVADKPWYVAFTAVMWVTATVFGGLFLVIGPPALAWLTKPRQQVSSRPDGDDFELPPPEPDEVTQVAPRPGEKGPHRG